VARKYFPISTLPLFSADLLSRCPSQAGEYMVAHILKLMNLHYIGTEVYANPLILIFDDFRLIVFEGPPDLGFGYDLVNGLANEFDTNRSNYLLVSLPSS
jgi:hypothetical protein